MFHIPKTFILAFVGLSILAAFGIHRLQTGELAMAREPASKDAREQVYDLKSLFTAARSTVGFKQTANSAEGSCQCLSGPERQADVMIEDEAACSKDRLYLKGMVDSLPVLYREGRLRSASEFPKECLIYTMRKFQAETDKNASPVFSRCVKKGEKGFAFDESNLKPCVTRSYVNVVYNYFSDMADCLGLQQRSLIPKFYLESGFHLSSQSPTGAVGLGQLTAIAIQHANAKFEEFQNYVKTSGKPSCERLSAGVQKLIPVRNLDRGNCSKLVALQNPLANFFYVGITEMENRLIIRNMISKSKGSRFDIYSKMAKLGLARGSYDPERVEEIIATLAYNAGAGSAVILMSNYLDHFKRVSKRKLKLADLGVQGSPDKVPGFFEYAKNHQRVGNRGYLDNVAMKARELNQQFKEGTCVPESFLSL